MNQMKLCAYKSDTRIAGGWDGKQAAVFVRADSLTKWEEWHKVAADAICAATIGRPDGTIKVAFAPASNLADSPRHIVQPISKGKWDSFAIWINAKCDSEQAFLLAYSYAKAEAEKLIEEAARKPRHIGESLLAQCAKEDEEQQEALEKLLPEQKPVDLTSLLGDEPKQRPLTDLL